MGVLGRGLASLIPKRDRGNAEEVLEQIDQMEFDVPARDGGGVEQAVKPSAGLSDFEQLDHIEDMPMPAKPLTTPLPFDPFEAEGGAQAVLEKRAKAEATATARKRSLKVSEETEEGVIQAEASVTETAEAPVVEKEVAPPEPAVEEKPEPVEVAPQPEMEVPKPEPAVEAKAEGDEEATMPGFGEEGASSVWDKHEQNIEHIAIGDIKINPLQPRRSFDPQELDELAQSISQHGILQPLVVRRLDDGGFELIAGERRLRASKKLGWTKVPAVVRRDVKSDQSRLVFALIENIQRQNLDPIEEALAYKQLNEEYGLTHEEIGQRMGKSRVAVTNIVRILQLPAEIQRGLMEGKITVGHGKAILMIPDEEKQIKFYHHLIDEGLTVRKAEVRARRIQRTMNLNDPLRRRGHVGRHPLALKYSPALEERYGFDARIDNVDGQNKFQVVFWAHNEGELENLVGMLLGTKALPEGMDEDVMGPVA
ncbi:MAG: ParB/RepB/Spo0J family partition protein [Candidatus Andersenbacteria bacterium]|nr:ParB/RepB/Spo0J family partition protein [Candidatus Andersenbacteria bacterium]